MTRDGAVRAAAARLAVAGVVSPSVDARLLALEAFRLTLSGLVADGGRSVTADDAARLDAMLERRLRGEPVDRILGQREFWGLPFLVTPATLAPRADTETVVAAALGAAGPADEPLRILDLGTGTGCLLLALLSERSDATGLGLDRSFEAAATAQENARRLGLDDRARFVVGDWTAALSGRFDLIVSNPPYIPTLDIGGLDREVRLHDPMLALDGGTDGLTAYRAILATAPGRLAPDGAVVLELGVGQRDKVLGLAAAAGFSDVSARMDLAGVARALTLRRGSQKSLGIRGRNG